MGHDISVWPGLHAIGQRRRPNHLRHLIKQPDALPLYFTRMHVDAWRASVVHSTIWLESGVATPIPDD